MTADQTIEIHHRIPPRDGVGILLEAGQRLRVIDPAGRQPCCLVAFSRLDKRELYSASRSLYYAGTIYLTTGNVLHSNRSNPMLTIVADTAGRHDLLLPTCGRESVRLAGSADQLCLTQLVLSLAEFGVRPDQIPTPFNLFMSVAVDRDGRLVIQPPSSGPGDHVELRAEMDLVVGLTAAALPMPGVTTPKPIDYEVLNAEE